VPNEVMPKTIRESTMQSTPTETLTILSASPNEEDHRSLEQIIGHSKWTLLRADKLHSLRALLARHDVSVIVCERDLAPGTWTEVLDYLQEMPHPPSLIVTSQHADEKLWSVVLNMGGWDVLAKPFDRSEVLRSIRHAWEHWYRHLKMTASPMRIMTAAG
jgi:DNA-binding NtrC family response regulator